MSDQIIKLERDRYWKALTSIRHRLEQFEQGYASIHPSEPFEKNYSSGETHGQWSAWNSARKIVDDEISKAGN